MTYNSLVSQMLATVDRSDIVITDYVSDFINQAHERISRDGVSLEMVTYANGSLPLTSSMPKPSLWKRPLSFNIKIPDPSGNSYPDQYQIVEWRSYDYCRQYYPADSALPLRSLLPVFYGDYGRENFILSPVPSISYNFELSFYGTPPLLSPLIQTNMLTKYVPNLLLYASMLEMSNFLKEDDRIAVWTQTYEKALEGVNLSDIQSKEDRFAKREKD
jgi:hypothetical protein